MLDRRAALAGLSAFGLLPAAGRAWGRSRLQIPPIEARFTPDDARVLISARLNGGEPLSLAIDTGAELSGLRQVVADRLRLHKTRDVRLNGADFPLYAIDELVIADVVRQQGVALFGLAGPTLGADGLLAAGLVTSVDSELEFERGVWRLHPDGQADRPGYARLTSELRRAATQGLSVRPFADVAVQGRTVRAVLDTGGPRALSIDFGTANALGLWADRVAYAPVARRGISGTANVPARLVRADRIEIGGEVYTRTLILLRPRDDPAAPPVVGLPLLRTLDLSFDRAGGSVWARRNGLSPTEGDYALSGLWLDPERASVRVSDVGAGSPAAAAGVRAGDVLEGPRTLRDALDLVQGPAGKAVSLSLRRDGQTIAAAYTLRPWL